MNRFAQVFGMLLAALKEKVQLKEFVGGQSMVKKKFLDKYGLIAHNDEATIIHHRKLVLKGGLLSERIIWKVPATIQYPFGIKYRLILVNPITQEVILLYDNHWPKGPHIHGLKGEKPYDFKDSEILLIDFNVESVTEVKKYHENKKNSY